MLNRIAAYFSGRGYESQIIDMTGGRFKLVSAQLI